MENNITYDINRIGAFLEAHGWKRSVAGDEDFTAATEALKTALEHKLGLVVSGKYGVGKTALVEAALGLFGRFRRVRLGIPEDAEMLTGEWMDMWAEDLHHENVLLDDVGAEMGRNDYGVRSELVTQFVVKFHEKRMDREEETPPRLVITTNLSSEEIDARYGGRLYSRLKDLCVPLQLKGRDKRHWTLGGAA